MKPTTLWIGTALRLSATLAVAAGCASTPPPVTPLEMIVARAQQSAEQAKEAAGRARAAADAAEGAVEALHDQPARIVRTPDGIVIIKAAPKPSLVIGISKRDLAVSPIPGHAPML